MSAEYTPVPAAAPVLRGDPSGLRAVLALALVLFGLTVVLERDGTWLPAPSAGERGADRALEILLGARGSMLPPFRAAGAGNEHVGELMRLGDRLLTGTGARGLRVAFLARGQVLRGARSFDVAGPFSEVRALRRAVDEAAAGEVLALASSGSLRAGSDEARAALRGVAETLGGRARPGEVSAESWALLALREERGWTPLAESYSRESGVALAYVLRPDLEQRPPPAGELALVRAGERSEVFLEEELVRASTRTEGLVHAPAGSVMGRRLAGILLPPAGRLGWEGVPVGGGSGLVAWVGLADPVSSEGDAATLSIRADGELALEQVLRAGAPLSRIEVDLGRFAGRAIALEIGAEALQGRPTVLLGRPLLVRGYDRSPGALWADER
jgi:hypothetical protein